MLQVRGRKMQKGGNRNLYEGGFGPDHAFWGGGGGGVADSPK